MLVLLQVQVHPPPPVPLGSLDAFQLWSVLGGGAFCTTALPSLLYKEVLSQASKGRAAGDPENILGELPHPLRPSHTPLRTVSP